MQNLNMRSDRFAKRLISDADIDDHFRYVEEFQYIMHLRLFGQLLTVFSNTNFLTVHYGRRVIPEREFDTISNKACLDDGYQLAEYPNDFMENFIDTVSFTHS